MAYIAPPDTVSKGYWAVIISLDWVGDIPLTAEKLPLTDQPCCSYGGWNDGYNVYLQIRWQAITEKRQRAFKVVMESDRETEISGIPMKVSSHRGMDKYTH